jgi:hypothetical protein
MSPVVFLVLASLVFIALCIGAYWTARSGGQVMNARSKFVPMITITGTPIGLQLIDCRGAKCVRSNRTTAPTRAGSTRTPASGRPCASKRRGSACAISPSCWAISMPTKDPHIAMIDAYEQLEAIKAKVRAAIQMAKTKQGLGGLTEDDKLMMKAIKAEAIDATRRVQDRLYEEIEGHG